MNNDKGDDTIKYKCSFFRRYIIHAIRIYDDAYVSKNSSL